MQKHSPVAGEIPGGKLHHDLTGAEVGKEQRLLVIVCRARGGEIRSIPGLYPQPGRRATRLSLRCTMIFSG